MSTPPEIIDTLESVLEIYFSGVRHRERAAFILCDNLVEMTCKTKAKQDDYRFRPVTFMMLVLLQVWYIAIRMQTPLVDECLNDVGIIVFLPYDSQLKSPN